MPLDKLPGNFNCPYCGVEMRKGDKHAATIEKKNLERPTIIVKCELVRTFEVAVKEVE